MPPISDLVRDSKLETTFCLGYTQHEYHVSGDTPRQRRMRVEERWKRGRNLGTGSFGIVWLEKLIVENGEEKYRAVKEIRKGMQRSKAIDYSRELEAIAKFSHQKVQKSSFFSTLLLFSVPSLLLSHQLSEAYRGKYSMKCAL